MILYLKCNSIKILLNKVPIRSRHTFYYSKIVQDYCNGLDDRKSNHQLRSHRYQYLVSQSLVFTRNYSILSPLQYTDTNTYIKNVSSSSKTYSNIYTRQFLTKASDAANEDPSTKRKDNDKKTGGILKSKHSDDNEENLTLFQRFKLMYSRYWYVLVPVHCVTSVIWFGGFYFAAKSGIDITHLERLGIPEYVLYYLRGNNAGYYGIAYGLYKIATPARYTVTLTGSTLSISYLKDKGYIKPIPTKDELKLMYQDKREEILDKTEEVKEKYQEKKEEFRGKYQEKKGEFIEKYQDKSEEFIEKYQDRSEEFKEKYQDRKEEMIEKYQDKSKDFRENYFDRREEMIEKYQDRKEEMIEKYQDKSKDFRENYYDRREEIFEKYQDKGKELRDKYQERRKEFFDNLNEMKNKHKKR